MTNATATYRIQLMGIEWVIVKMNGSHTEVMPRRFNRRRLTDARKYLAELTA
jgi:hypothetical protein